MKQSMYGHSGPDFRAPMSDQERHHALLDFDNAERVNTPEAYRQWCEKWGRRVVDYLWSRAT